MGDNQALREQIAQAILGQLCPTSCGYRISSAGMLLGKDGAMRFHHEQGGPCSIHVGTSRALADAVLPVVQAHEKDLIEEIEEFAVELAEERADRSSLRDAVAQLADQLDGKSRTELDPDASDLALAVGIVSQQNQRELARRLRSLLPQEGQK